MRAGDTVTVHTNTTGNYKGRLHLFNSMKIILTKASNHNGEHKGQVTIYMHEIKLIKV